MKDTIKNIKIINCDCDYDGKAYVVLAMNGGFAAREFWVGDESPFRGNYAFFNVLASYLKTVVDDEDFSVAVKPSATLLSFTCKNREISDKLNYVLKLLTNIDVGEKLFDELYARMKDNFALMYKAESFRAQYKALEFTEYNKNFLREDLIADIEKLSYSDFRQCVEKLLVIENFMVLILGNFGKDGQEVKLDVDMPLSEKAPVSLVAFQKDPYLRTDAHTMGRGRKNCFCNAITFTCTGAETDTGARYFLQMLFRERLKREDTISSFDFHDAGFVLCGEKLEAFKPLLTAQWQEDEFDKTKKQLLDRYMGMLIHTPGELAQEAAQLALAGADLMHMVTLLGHASFEEFMHVVQQANIMINEAQVIISVGGDV